MPAFSYAEIVARMKGRLKNSANKLEGGFASDILQAVGQELAEMVAIKVDTIPDRVLLDTAESTDLDLKTKEYAETRLSGEGDDAYRARVFQKIQTVRTSGNEADYEYWAMEVIGGGGSAKCFGIWNGPNTVLVVIMPPQLEDMTDEQITTLVEAVATHIERKRPIGPEVTIRAATPWWVDVEVTVKCHVSFTLEAVTQTITEALQAYISSISFKSDTPLSYFRLGEQVITAPGVADLTEYTINGGTTSITAPRECYYALGEVIVHVTV